MLSQVPLPQCICQLLLAGFQLLLQGVGLLLCLLLLLPCLCQLLSQGLRLGL
jgi:Na+-transporting methylmalonyl-CoA/oxaloacetate decarboxylase gamma subunit